MRRRQRGRDVGAVEGRRGGERGARTAMTRCPGRSGEGFVMARRPQGGARTVMPHRTMRDEGSTMTRRLLVPGAGPVVGPARPARHADGADPAPRPQWPGVRQHPVPWGWRADGHASVRWNAR